MSTFPPQTGRPVVFYAPHDDDEVILMSKPIIHHMLAGREVHVVLCSNGSTSNAFEEINGLALDPTWWKGYHYPEHEGYRALTREEFSRARWRETINGCLQMGVKRENIHLGLAPNDLDGELDNPFGLPVSIDVLWAAEVIQSWAEFFQGQGYSSVGHYTAHWGDANPDHSALGTALRSYRLSGDPTYADSRWMTKPEQAVALGAEIYAIPSEFATEINFRMAKAALCYGAWAPADPPENGSFAIGYHSVYAQYFVGVLGGYPNHIVRNP
jgi:LmbE family N-acetylglucosaminyl deacetylase